jgi:hypothetical protein
VINIIVQKVSPKGLSDPEKIYDKGIYKIYSAQKTIATMMDIEVMWRRVRRLRVRFRKDVYSTSSH